MRVTSDRTTVSAKRTFSIDEDSPIVTQAYASTPRAVRIREGVITYTWHDGRFVVGGRYAIHLTGSVQLKSGGDSKVDHTRHPETAPGCHRLPELVLADGWEWLQAIIDLLRPNPDMSTTALLDHEITTG